MEMMPLTKTQEAELMLRCSEQGRFMDVVKEHMLVGVTEEDVGDRVRWIHYGTRSRKCSCWLFV